MGIIDVVVGGQFGSEGKGHVTQQLVQKHHDESKPVLNVRVAGPNAGHTAWDHQGRRWPLRQVPVGVTVGGRAMIAAGSEIDPHVLLEEVVALRDAGLLKEGQLDVDPQATVIDEVHHRTERRLEEEGNHGSTAKGIGAARADRILRKAAILGSRPTVCAKLSEAGVVIRPTARTLREWVTGHGAIVVEGTQGYGLGLHSGYYPYVTSSNCRAIDFLAMAGLNPWWGGLGGSATDWFRVWVVLRPYPIRIAGNSGPLRNETTWEELGLPEEITTVTRKIRRVGAWDPRGAAEAVAANGGPPHVRAAFTMLDQVFPDVTGDDLATFDSEPRRWLRAREEEIGCNVEMATFSPTSAVWL